MSAALDDNLEIGFFHEDRVKVRFRGNASIHLYLLSALCILRCGYFKAEKP
jgi:hypothetical protein